MTRGAGPVTVTATAFGSHIADAVAVERDTRYVLFSRQGAVTNVGAELLATLRRGPWVGTATYTYVRAREDADNGRQDVALTPRHSAGLVGMWEDEPYVILGALAEKRIGHVRILLNAENLTNVRQTRWDSLLRPSRGVDGRWTVDAWAPLDGRGVNGGVRVGF